MKKFLILFLMIILNFGVFANPQKGISESEDELALLLEYANYNSESSDSNSNDLEDLDLLLLEDIELFSDIDLDIINEILNIKY